LNHFNKNDFTIDSLENELRVDELCRKLLKDFHQHLLRNGVPPLDAGTMAHGADYYLRDYLVSARCRNLFQEKEGDVRTFAATWYIISTLEPKVEELEGHLSGVREFYRFLHSQELISGEYLSQIEKECDGISWYNERIESFWNIRDDGYLAWERECSLKER
jgi:hypothetical protein